MMEPVRTFDYVALLVENVSLWELMLLAVLVWLAFRPDLLKRITRFKLGDLEIELEKLRSEVNETKEDVRALEHEREAFNALLTGLDPHAPVGDLARASEQLKAHARTMGDIRSVGVYLTEEATAEQLYGAAVTLRERRPTELTTPLLDCLDRLAKQDDLGGVRLHTVWLLTSALHKMLIAAIRDGVSPPIPAAELRRANAVLDRLERNPRVQQDRPDNPDSGVRGPIRHARSWLKKGLEAA